MNFAREKSLPFLRSAAQALYQENQGLKQRVAALEARLGEAAAAEEEKGLLAELLALRERQLFAKSSEKNASQQKPKKKPREPHPGHGPREQPHLATTEVSHDLPPEERVCPKCGGEMEVFGADVSELITVLERHFVLQTHRRAKYRCSCEDCVKRAPGPTPIVPGGRYSPEFAVECAEAKYGQHLPLERQVVAMKFAGLQVDSQTLWDQLTALARLCKPTYLAILEAIRQQPVIGADETRWPLLDNGVTKENKLYQTWCIQTADMAGYCILDNRGKEAASHVLAGFSGIAIVDGYEVYTSLAKDLAKARQENPSTPVFTIANCWAHVRRKFRDAELHFPEPCGIALALIQELFNVERQAQNDNGDLAALRQSTSKPLVDKLFAWASQQHALPQSGLGKALHYLLERKEGLSRFLDNPAIPLTNNASERALRGVVLGRKNFSGSRSRLGTEVAALFYTLIETAKLHGFSPKAYLLAIAQAAIHERARLEAAFQASIARAYADGETPPPRPSTRPLPEVILMPADFKAQLEAASSAFSMS